MNLILTSFTLMTYAVDETFMRKFSRHKDIGWPKHKNNQAILFLSPQIAMSIPPIYRHLMAMPRTKGFKYYLPVYYDSCYGSDQSWGIKWDEPSRTKRKGFLLAMKWWLHTKWYFDIIIVFCVVTFGLYCCFPAAQSSWYAGIYWVCLQRFHEIWEQVE